MDVSRVKLYRSSIEDFKLLESILIEALEDTLFTYDELKKKILLLSDEDLSNLLNCNKLNIVTEFSKYCGYSTKFSILTARREKAEKEQKAKKLEQSKQPELLLF